MDVLAICSWNKKPLIKEEEEEVFVVKSKVCRGS